MIIYGFHIMPSNPTYLPIYSHVLSALAIFPQIKTQLKRKTKQQTKQRDLKNDRNKNNIKKKNILPGSCSVVCWVTYYIQPVHLFGKYSFPGVIGLAWGPWFLLKDRLWAVTCAPLRYPVVGLCLWDPAVLDL